MYLGPKALFFFKKLIYTKGIEIRIILMEDKMKQTIYKKIFPCILAFVMIFSISGQAFCAALGGPLPKSGESKHGGPFMGPFTKEYNDQLKDTLTKIVFATNDIPGECKGSLEQRYTCAYKNFAKAAQDYMEYIEILHEYAKNPTDANKRKYEETKKNLGISEKNDLKEEFSKIAQLGIIFEEWKKEYKKQKEEYQEYLIKEYNEKANKFIAAVKEKTKENCIKLGSEINELYNSSTGDNFKDWENRRLAFEKEKNLHKVCFGSPVLVEEDFKNGKLGLTYDEYVEMKYREYYDRYVLRHQSPKTQYLLSKGYAKDYGMLDAEDIKSLFLLNVDLGIQSLGALAAEYDIASSLCNGDTSFENEFYDKEIFALNYNDNGSQKKNDVKEYLNKTDQITREDYNHMFRYVREIKLQTFKELSDRIPQIVELAEKETLGSIAYKLEISLPTYKEMLRGSKKIETAVKQGKFKDINTIQDIRIALDILMENLNVKSLDWVFVGFPATLFDYEQKKDSYAKYRYSINSEDSYDISFLKDMLKVQLQYFGNKNGVWNKVAKGLENNIVTEQAEKIDTLEYMVSLSKYVADEDLRGQLIQPALSLRNMNAESTIQQIKKIEADFIKDIPTFVNSAETSQLAADGIVKMIILNTLANESRMMFRSRQNIAKNDSSVFIKYQKSLIDINSYMERGIVNMEEIKSLLNEVSSK